MFKEIIEKTIHDEKARLEMAISFKRAFVTYFGEYMEDPSVEELLSYLRSISENMLYRIFFAVYGGDASEDDKDFSSVFVAMISNHYIKVFSLDFDDEVHYRTVHILNSLIKEKQTSKSILYIKDGIIKTDLINDNLCNSHNEGG